MLATLCGVANEIERWEAIVHNWDVIANKATKILIRIWL
jgi:hypothetical protein